MITELFEKAIQMLKNSGKDKKKSKLMFELVLPLKISEKSVDTSRDFCYSDSVVRKTNLEKQIKIRRKRSETSLHREAEAGRPYVCKS